MPRTRPLGEWMREQGRIVVRNSSGQYIAKKDFKSRLYARYKASGRPENEIKEFWSLVNPVYEQLSMSSSTAPIVKATSPQDHKKAMPKNFRESKKSKMNAPAALVTVSGQPDASQRTLVHKSGVDSRLSPTLTSVGFGQQSGGWQGPLNPKIRELKAVAEMAYGTANPGLNQNDSSLIPSLADQFQLLGLQNRLETVDTESRSTSTNIAKNAVVFSTAVLEKHSFREFPQFSLLASVCPGDDMCSTEASDPRLFLNTNIPFSAFICGLQGSGKSHTLSTLLENCLIQSDELGVLQSPLSALVFHFGQFTSRSTFWPCEAAFLAHPHPDYLKSPGIRSVTILAAPSNYFNLSESYKAIPGVNIRPFKLRSRELNVRSMLVLMSVDQTSKPPLYMGQIIRILREIAGSSAEDFNYKTFKEAVKSCPLSKDQKSFLDQRLELLESFLDLEDSTPDLKFEAGSISIVDLSCPFVDANTACALFDIYMSIYLECDPSIGKVIAIDEAHKYMTDTTASKAFTESLLTVIRQQRHIGARVIISTQEPTISPRLIDLCSILVIHRFSSPEWFNVIRKHVSINETEKATLAQLFGQINNLEVGEGLLFAPSSVLSKQEKNRQILFQLGSTLLKIKMRKRVTWDGGKSVVCV